MEDIVIVGFGGHAKSVADCIERMHKFNIVGYTDIEEHPSRYRYLGTDDELESLYRSGVRKAILGIGYLGKGDVRRRLYNRLKDIGFELPIIVDPSAIVSETATIDEGTFIGKGAIINTESVIGKSVIVNTKALIEHECSIGDFSHVAVGATVCGQVKVGKNTLVGANSTIIQCVEVGDNQIVPAGTTLR